MKVIGEYLDCEVCSDPLRYDMNFVHREVNIISALS